MLVGVRLRPGVAYLVSGIPAATVLHRRLKLSGPPFDALAADRCATRTPQQNIDVLQRFLVDRLAGATVHGVVATALDAIQRAHGSVRVADVAAGCGVSERHLNRLMRTWIGYGAKRFGRVVRFQETLKEIEQAPALSGAALASETGYFDQAHLTLDMTQMPATRHATWRCSAWPIFTRPAATGLSRVWRLEARGWGWRLEAGLSSL
jgi:AraC-like DNA-binding protein